MKDKDGKAYYLNKLMTGADKVELCGGAVWLCESALDALHQGRDVFRQALAVRVQLLL